MKTASVEKTKVDVGYSYNDEYDDLVTVLFIHNGWCLVECDTHSKPYLVQLDYIKTIKNESEENTIEYD